MGTRLALLLAVILAYTLWDAGDQQLIKGWLVCMALITVIRIVMGTLSKREYDSGSRQRTMDYWYLLVILSTAAGWGFAAYMLFPGETVPQIVTAFILAGIVSGGLAVLSPIIRFYYVYAALVLLPLAARTLQLDSQYQILAWLILLFYLGVSFAGQRINKSMMTTLELRFHNESLVKFLSQARNESEDLNEELSMEIEQRKRIEKELHKAKELAEMASRAISCFIISKPKIRWVFSSATVIFYCPQRKEGTTGVDPYNLFKFSLSP